jgi:hypothetical protein
VKLGDTGVDNLFNELQFVLDQDGGRMARAVRWLAVRGYRILKGAILLVLRLRWRVRRLGEP